MSHTVPESEFVESFPTYTNKSVRFDLRVWRRKLEITTAEGTETVSELVAATNEGYAAFPRGGGVFEIRALGVTVLAER